MDDHSASARVKEQLDRSADDQPFDIRFGILMLTVYSVGIFFVDSWYGLAIYTLLLAVAVLFLVYRGIKARGILMLGIPAYVIVAITIVFNLLWWDEGGISISIDGLERGLFLASRILLILWASIALCMTVSMDRIENALSSVLAPLKRVGIPADDIAVACSIALRFIPTSLDSYRTIRDSQWSRCARTDSGPLTERIKAHAAILMPMTIGLFRNADRLSTAMESRCYGVAEDRTSLHILKANYVGIAAACAFCCACILCSLML